MKPSILVLTAVAGLTTAQIIDGPRKETGAHDVIANIDAAQHMTTDALPYAAKLVPGDKTVLLMDLANMTKYISGTVDEASQALPEPSVTIEEDVQTDMCEAYYGLTTTVDTFIELFLRKTGFLETALGAGNLGMQLYGLNEALEGLLEGLVLHAHSCADKVRDAKHHLDEKMLYALDIYCGGTYGRLGLGAGKDMELE